MKARALILYPEEALTDEEVSILLAGWEPGLEVTVRASLIDDQKGQWSSWATFIIDSSGMLDLSKVEPLTGTYPGVDPMGLFWSMQPQKNSGMFDKRNLSPKEITITVEIDRQVVKSGTIRRLFLGDDVIQKEVREEGIVGTFYYPDRSKPSPTILTLRGAGHVGEDDFFAALLASKGYAVFSLAYWGLEGLPKRIADIPLEYIHKGIDWMQRQKIGKGGSISLVGTSIGGELALLAGSIFPEVTAVASLGGSSVVYDRTGPNDPSQSPWSYQAEELSFLRVDYSEMKRRRPPSTLAGYLHPLQNENAMAGAVIPVEKIQGPIFLASGTDDQAWPSTVLANIVYNRLAIHQHSHPYYHFSYEGAGHVFGGILPPYMPTTRNVFKHPATLMQSACGGSPRANAHAIVDSWNKLLHFLDTHHKIDRETPVKKESLAGQV